MAEENSTGAGPDSRASGSASGGSDQGTRRFRRPVRRSMTTRSDHSEDVEKSRSSFTNWVIGAGLGWAALAAFMVIVFGLSAFRPWQVFVVAAAISAASGALGGTVGFVFGVPRVLTGTGAETKRQTDGRIESNSNLEQISDWLTKIVVGVGLTQLYQIPGALGRLGAAIAPGLGGQEGSGAFGVALVLYTFFLAFLIVYMWTRTRFLEVLQQFTQSGKKEPKDEQSTEAGAGSDPKGVPRSP